MKRIISSVAALLLASGCASHVGEHWGESYQVAKEQQIENPDAGDEVRPVEGLGATTADRVTVNYHERQQEQSQDDDQSSLFDLIQSN